MQAAALCAAQPWILTPAQQRPTGSRHAASPRPTSAAAAWQRRRPAAAGGGTSSSGRGRGRLLVTAAIKVRKGKQVLCNKTLKAKEGSEAAVAQLCEGMAEWSRERMADRGSGVLAFQFSEVRSEAAALQRLGNQPRRGLLLLPHPWLAGTEPDSALLLALPVRPRPPRPRLSCPALQDDYEKGTFHFMELYANQKAMTDHNSHDQVKTFVQKVGGRARSGGRVAPATAAPALPPHAPNAVHQQRLLHPMPPPSRAHTASRSWRSTWRAPWAWCCTSTTMARSGPPAWR